MCPHFIPLTCPGPHLAHPPSQKTLHRTASPQPAGAPGPAWQMQCDLAAAGWTVQETSPDAAQEAAGPADCRGEAGSRGRSGMMCTSIHQPAPHTPGHAYTLCAQGRKHTFLTSDTPHALPRGGDSPHPGARPSPQLPHPFIWFRMNQPILLAGKELSSFPEDGSRLGFAPTVM